MDKNSKYDKSFSKFGTGVKSLRWKNFKSSALRYNEIIKDINFENKTILDVGCGMGNIIPFISTKTLNFKYTGIDNFEKFLIEAKLRFPEHIFLNNDYFSHPINETFDIIICSGALNSITDNPLKDRCKNIKLLYSKTNYVLAFNMSGHYPVLLNKDKNSIYYINSLDILNYCFTLTTKIIFKQHYHNKDFTILLFK